MSFYQGRAIRSEKPARRGTGHRLRRVLTLFLAIGIAGVLTQVPWGALRARVFDLREIRVEGAHYLEPRAITDAAGVKIGSDVFGIDLDRARQALLMHPRVARARVELRPPHALAVSIEERTPVLLVDHGVPWELDSTGVLLPPLGQGAVADVPMLVGLSAAALAPGTQVRSPAVSRGLAWVQALGVRELQLAGQISEVDVSDPRSTVLTLMNGTRVLTPAWPPSTRSLSALRVVLADLHQRGTLAQEVDLRFENQVIVRPVEGKDEDGARTS